MAPVWPSAVSAASAAGCSELWDEECVSGDAEIRASARSGGIELEVISQQGQWSNLVGAGQGIERRRIPI